MGKAETYYHEAVRWLSGTAWPWLRDKPFRYTVPAALFLVLTGWALAVAPPWSMTEPEEAEATLEFLAADGTMIARQGPAPIEPVAVEELPEHVRNAFIGIEDRRFESHFGIDPQGLARAFLANMGAGGVVEGGSTITQQFVKNRYLSQDRTIARKVKELMLANWVEVWMSKDEILGAYLDAAYYGDGQYGLVNASRHYFDREPAELTLGQSAMLAGLLKAPSRLAPTEDREASLERMEVVYTAMVDAGLVTQEDVDAEPDPAVTHPEEPPIPHGNWFTDWIARDLGEGATGTIRTTLDADLQRHAEKVIADAPLGEAEVALIAMRPDGKVVAMVGGKEWTPEAYNRALFAERQPGSTFKLFDYLAAFRDGATPNDVMLDAPLELGSWKPANAYSGYRGPITIREAFAVSSNTVAVRAAQTAGYDEVQKATSDLGVRSDMPANESMPLGTNAMTLAELASSYAAFAGGRYPVTIYGRQGEWSNPSNELDPTREWQPMLDLLWHSANVGTGRRAVLDQPTFGKTGTTQDGRDALFVGFAGDLVVAVWVGRDDNKPVPGASGGRLPAQIWKSFMEGADVKPSPVLAAIFDPSRMRLAMSEPRTQRATLEPARAERARERRGPRGKKRRGRGKRGRY